MEWWVIFLFFIHFIIAVWIYYDAEKRGYKKDDREWWAVAGLFLGIVALLCWLFERKSKREMIRKYKMEELKKKEFKKSTIGKIYFDVLDFGSKLLKVIGKILKVVGILILIYVVFLVAFFGGLFGTLLSTSPGEEPSEPQTSSLTDYDITVYENGEPYYSLYCTKIDPYNLDVRKASSDAVRKHPGEYSVDQLLDIYDWVKQNIVYLNVPVKLMATPYNPSETLITKCGDCKNQAVLIASMIESIGGIAKVVVDPVCNHAYSIVYFGKPDTDMNKYTKIISYRYNKPLSIRYYTNDEGIWVIFDPAGGMYPGETLEKCKGNRTVYAISSCVKPPQ